jgi:hypothetical protein
VGGGSAAGGGTGAASEGDGDELCRGLVAEELRGGRGGASAVEDPTC